jgi:hypothetical protein
MRKVLVAVIAVTLALAYCSKEDDETGPTDPVLVPPTDTSNVAVDSALYGIWHRYDAGGSLIEQNAAWFSDDSIVVSGQPTLKGIIDPQFAMRLIAADGQIYLDPQSVSFPNDYHYDYALSTSGQTTLYLVRELTSTATSPTASTAGVYILRRDRDTIMDVCLITDSLLGTWDRYDSTGATLLESDFLVVRPDSIVYRRAVTWKGFIDPMGTTGQTLVAGDGQIWLDYHFSEYPDRYIYDYAMFNNGTSMFFADQTDATYTSPNLSSDFIVRYLKKR